MNNFIVRLLSMEINNFKNIKHGSIDLTKKESSEATVLGIYGQNGSGKTSVIQVLEIFKSLGLSLSLRDDINNLIKINENECSIDLKFSIKINNEEQYIVIYSFRISKSTSSISYEKLSISKKEVDDSWSKTSTYFECDFSDDIQVFKPRYRYRNLVGGEQNNKINLSVALKLSKNNRTSLLFSQSFNEVLKGSSEEELFKIVTVLKEYVKNNLFIISGSHNSVIGLDLLLPLTVYYKNNDIRIVGDIPINLEKPMETSVNTFNLIRTVINNMNGVIKAIVPGLSFSIKDYGEQILIDNKPGRRYELMSNRYDEAFPLRYESDGIKRLFSELSVLIAVYNNPSILVAIDELDAGIFESLLGTIIHVIDETGQGQLIFTSHNLRPLEVLDNEKIIFSTTNENNRYIRMINIRGSNNLRDCYLRALTIGGQQEDLATDMKETEIRRALKLE